MASTSASTVLTGAPSSSRCRRRVLDLLRSSEFRAANRFSLSFQGLRTGVSRERILTSRRTRKCGMARASFNVAYEFEDAFSALSLPVPPEPVLFPRKVLNLKFAVLLMRSAYEAVDALDFIPMDKFQIKFWKLRQSEVEPYTLQCRPLRVKYGDLTDPLYFDFISFSQFAAISNEMKTGEVIFQEKVGLDGESRTVRRDERLKDNATLPAAFINKAGDLLYEKLIEGFEGEAFDVPSPASSDFLAAADDVKKLVQVFVDKGYALKSSVEPVQFSANQPGGKLRVKLEGSATQWGVRALASRRALLLNDFAALAVGAYLRACGFAASPKVTFGTANLASSRERSSQPHNHRHQADQPCRRPGSLT